MEEKKLRYMSLQKGHHTLTLLNGEVIKAGMVFDAYEKDIPKGFADLVRIISLAKEVVERPVRNKQLPKPEIEEEDTEETGTEQVIDSEIEEEDVKEKEIEQKPKPVYTKKHVGGGKYNVLNEEGEKMNENPLTGIKAMQLIDSLTK
jgi:hypothetical protein